MKKEVLLAFYLAYRLYIFPALVALSSIFLIVFVIYPQINNFLVKSSGLGQTVKKSQLLEVKAKELTDLNQEILKEKLNVLVKALPADKDYVYIMALIQDLVARSGYNLVSLSFIQNVESLRSQSYSVKLELLGKETSLDTLLENIEHSPRVMRVGGIDINTRSGSELINLGLTIEAFYAPIPQALGLVEDPLPQLSAPEEEIIARFSRPTVSPSVSVGVAPTLGPRGRQNPFE